MAFSKNTTHGLTKERSYTMSNEITQRQDAAIDAARKAVEKMQLAAEYLETDSEHFVGRQKDVVTKIIYQLREDATILKGWLRNGWIN